MMRIITGKAKGVRLDTLPGDATRPTSERVKEAIFSSLQFDLDGRRALDLFAGSGQLGLEALSRGALSCTFIDAAPEAIAVVKDNAKKTGFFSDCKYLISDYRSYLRKAGKGDGFTLIFLDPPYDSGLTEKALARIKAFDILSNGGIIICETRAETAISPPDPPYCMKKQYLYGKVKITTIVKETQGYDDSDLSGQL